jgi:hypothetical protein
MNLTRIKKEIKTMRALNRSLFALFAATSSLALSGCLGTNTPDAAPAAINESASGTGFIAARGAGFEDMTTHITAGATDGATIGTDGPATFTAFTNANSGAFGFIVNLPADASAGGVADTAVLPSASFVNSTAVEFPAHTQEANIATDTAGTVAADGTGGAADGGHILVDKCGTSQNLQDSEYGIWAENGTTGGISATAATTVGRICDRCSDGNHADERHGSRVRWGCCRCCDLSDWRWRIYWHDKHDGEFCRRRRHYHWCYY